MCVQPVQNTSPESTVPKDTILLYITTEEDIKALKELMRDYETPEDVGVREFSSFVYGYSMTIELDDKPRVREIRNVRDEGVGSSESSRKRKGVSKYNRPQITTESP
jgi:hypothetical protein